MPLTPRTVLSDANVRSAMRQAWIESNPGATGGHEEGGFVVKDTDENLIVIRWSKGSQDSIRVLSHTNCKINGLDIIASFHTHPNTDGDYLQEPSETDTRAIRDDPDLKGKEYVGEFVISQEMIYLISAAGQVREIGDTQSALVE